jgi:hypothetical protein
MRKNLTEKYKMLRQLLHTPTPETTSKDPQIKRPLHRLLQKTDIYIYMAFFHSVLFSELFTDLTIRVFRVYISAKHEWCLNRLKMRHFQNLSFIYIYSKRKQSMEASITLLFHMCTYLARPMSLVSSYRTYTKHVHKYHMHRLSAALNIHGVTSMHVYRGLHLYCFADK